jgi:hypothetical protein
MPRQRRPPEEYVVDEFKEEPRYERLLQRTDVELAAIFERDPNLKRKIDTYQAVKAAARNTHARPQR